LHICDIPEEVFYARHKNVLKLISKRGYAEEIGLFIAGKYYLHVWGSRSCSGYLAKLVGADDYLTFYCASSIYCMAAHELNPIYTAFLQADALDNQMW